MANKKVPTIRFRRKREKLTNYRKRLGLLKSGKQRLIIRKTNKNMITQLVIYEKTGDKTVANANSQELQKYGWNISRGNTPAAYLTGLLIATKAKDKDAILDLGLQTPKKGSVIFACLKGCIDGGMNIEANEEIFPTEDRIKGKHISAEVEKLFEETKKKIIKG